MILCDSWEVLLRPLLRKRPTLRAALLAEGEAAYAPGIQGLQGIQGSSVQGLQGLQGRQGPWQRGERCLVWSNSAQRWCGLVLKATSFRHFPFTFDSEPAETSKFGQKLQENVIAQTFASSVQAFRDGCILHSLSNHNKVTSSRQWIFNEPHAHAQKM